ncbi:MAG: S41 family peptidase, partial [Peptococcaceae bacterium]|nr:S41 family peptidase [Peptococcaceae bacterium]
MKESIKLLRNILLAFCCITTLTFGVFVAANFSHVQKIAQTLVWIENSYLWETDKETLIDGAIRGMLDSLGDKYTAYMDEATLTSLMEHVSGNVYGIGVYVALDDTGRIVVLDAIPESPAEKVGIQSGDVIIAVDGKSVLGNSLDETVALIHGLPDTSVNITVERKDTEHTFTVARYELGTTETVIGGILEDQPDIAYIHITEFSEQTAVQFAKVVNELIPYGFDGMILDLRDNGGGEVSASIEIARVFVPKGPIVHLLKSDGAVETKHATKAQLGIPLVVLVNGNTASASEILSAALKESGVATIVGTQTFGKGLVQSIYFYHDDTAAKIT